MQERSNKQKKRKFSILFVIYILSFIPYLYLIYVSIFGIGFSFFFNSTIVYGIYAIGIALLYFGAFVPIYPTILIYQIIYTIVKYKSFTPKFRKNIKRIFIIFITYIAIITIITLGIEKNQKSKQYKQDKIVIEDYLKNEFGEQHYKNMKIPNKYESIYMIRTPLLEQESFSIYLDREAKEVTSTNFYIEFNKQYEMDDKLSTYLGLPENIKIRTKSSKYNLKKYNANNDNIETLLNDCYYKIEYVSIYTEYYNKEEVIQTIKNFYIKYYDNLYKKGRIDKYINFVIKVNKNNYNLVGTSNEYATICVWKNNDILEMNFSGYKYEGNYNYTIEKEKETINLDN